MSSLHNAVRSLGEAFNASMIMSKVREAVKLCENLQSQFSTCGYAHLSISGVRMDNSFVLTLKGETLETLKRILLS